MGATRRPTPRRLGIKLLQVRLKLDLSQVEMANRLREVPSPPRPADISRFELGSREPSLPLLLEYARLVKLPLEVLVDDKIEMPRRFPKPDRRRVDNRKRT